MLPAFFGLKSFLGFHINLEHGLHEGHTLIAPKLLVGLLGLGGLTCGCTKSLTILVIAAAVTSIMPLVVAAVGFAMLAKLLLCAFLGTQSLKPPDAFFLGLLSA